MLPTRLWSRPPRAFAAPMGWLSDFRTKLGCKFGRKGNACIALKRAFFFLFSTWICPDKKMMRRLQKLTKSANLTFHLHYLSPTCWTSSQPHACAPCKCFNQTDNCLKSHMKVKHEPFPWLWYPVIPCHMSQSDDRFTCQHLIKMPPPVKIWSQFSQSDQIWQVTGSSRYIDHAKELVFKIPHNCMTRCCYKAWPSPDKPGLE